MTVSRTTPTRASPTERIGEKAFADRIAEEVGKLWEFSTNPLITIAGTANAITAQVDGATIVTLAKGMSFDFVPLYNNTGATTLAIDAAAAAAIKDEDGAALAEGALIAGRSTRIYFNGTNFILRQRYRYLLKVSVARKPTSNELLFIDEVVFPVTFPAGFTGSRASSEVEADASAVFSIRKNDVEFGTITFAVGATTGTFAAASETAFATGDKLTVRAPASADATLSEIAISLLGRY